MQIPFIGGAYKGRSTELNAQECINLYPEIDQQQAKSVLALFGTPGMTEWCDTTKGEVVRALHVMGSYLYAIVGNTLYEIDSEGTATAISGTLDTDVGPVYMVDNGTQLMVVDSGDAGYIYTRAAATLTAISDSDFPVPSSVTFQDGYFIVTKNASGEFYICTLYDGAAWDASDYSTAETNPDNLIRCFSDHGELWLYGEESIEVWYNSGNVDFPFERIPGVHIQEGLGAAESIAQLDNSLFWLSNNGQIIRADGYTPRIISTRHLEYLFSTYPAISDAKAFGYVQEGHSFYILTFPRAYKTWAYDASTGFWHERSSYRGDVPERQSRHRTNCYAYFNDKHLIGDYENGKIYEWDMDVYTDAGNTIQRTRACPVIHNDQKQIQFNRFEIDFEGGVGLITGETYHVLDDGGDTSTIANWVKSKDGLDPVDETGIVKHGSHAIKLGIDASLHAADVAHWDNTTSQGDLREYQHDVLQLWVYFPTLDYLHATGSAIQILIGNAGSSYEYFQFLKSSLVVGWNLLQCDLDNPTVSSGTIDWTDIDWLEIRIDELTGNTTDFSIYVDSVRIAYTEVGADPQAMLQWSDDGGHTWGNEHWTDIGEIGKYATRAVWRRLGQGRNRVFRVKVSDPIKVVMIAAHLEAQPGAN